MIQLGIRHKKQFKRRHHAGFTLVEVIVTMAVMAILLSILGVSVISWVKHSEFNKCNEYARGIYTAASMKLSFLDLNDELDDTMEEVVKTVGGSGGVNHLKNILGDGYFPSDVHPENMYYLYAKKGDYDIYLGDKNYGGRATGQNLLFSLLDDYSYDKAVLNENIVLEINVDTCEVYAVFVSTYASALTYTPNGDYNEHGIVSLDACGSFAASRSEDTRYKLVLGYFCGGEGIAANFKTRQLSVTTNELINDETLHLRFTSNSVADMNRDVKFKITIRQPSSDPTKEDRKLFTMNISMLALEMNPNPDERYVATGGGIRLVPVKVCFFDASGNEFPFGTPYTYYFPFSVDSLGVMDLTLDAAVSAKVDTLVNHASIPFDQQKYSTSMMRFLNDASVFPYLEKTSPDLYAEIYAQALTEREATEMGLSRSNPTHASTLNAILDNNYVSTAATTSNTENALYARDVRKVDDRNTDATGKYDEILISNARHLANVRYYDAQGATHPFANNHQGRADFLIMQDIDFARATIYEYDFSSNKLEIEPDLTKQFKTIPKLYKHWTLSGRKSPLLQDSYTLTNFLIGNQSVYEPDVRPNGLGSFDLVGNDARALGIVNENEGTIAYVNVSGSTLIANAARSTEIVSGGAIGGTNIEQYVYSVKHELTDLEGAAMICGLNCETGVIDAVRTSDDCVAYAFLHEGSPTANPTDSARGAGMVIGVQKGKSISRVKASGLLRAQILDNSTELSAVNLKKWDELFLGETAPMEDLEAVRTAQIGLNQKAIGIGGIAGVTIVSKPSTASAIAAAYGEAKTDHKFIGLVQAFLEAIGLEQEKPVVNAVTVCGNQYTGGVTGNLYVLASAGIDHETPVILNALNKGIITASTYATNDPASTKGLYIGGIVGYANCGLIRDCVAKPGVEAAAAADYRDKTEVLLPGGEKTTVSHQRLMQDTRGTFVGGIVGFAEDVLIRGCETRSDGYVIGYDNVGGIAGMIKPSSGAGIQLEIEARGSDELINKGYVIGHDNVGGIVGENGSGSKVSYSTNRGVVAGFGKNIGGITGRNLGIEGKHAIVDNCGSFVYDYSGSVRELVCDTWQIFGNNAGGIVGYNEYGEINCSDTKELSNYTVSALVLGKNNVGGVVGLNGENGILASNLLVEGGQVLAVGDAVGGYIGCNLATGIFDYPIQIKPYRVVGARGVGGVIGVNLPVVGTRSAIHIIASNENVQGSVEGEQLVGGVIGVHRTLQSIGTLNSQTVLFKQQLSTASAITMLFDGTKDAYIDATSYVYDGTEKIRFFDTDAGFSTLIGKIITEEDPEKLINNADIYVGGIGGGVLGYNALSSQTVISGYDNIGAISQNENEDSRVKLTDYANFTDSNLKEALKDQKSSLVAGITGYANENMIIKDCENHGDILTEAGSGGIVAINHGRITDCGNFTNMGMTNSSFIGGIAAINYGVIASTQMGNSQVRYTLSGDSYVGGIAGVNVGSGGAIAGSCVNYADIDASISGVNVGGVVGYNDAIIEVWNTIGTAINEENQSISGGKNVGGIVGTNAGTIDFTQLSAESGNTVTANMIIDGDRCVGGWVGRQESYLPAIDNQNKCCQNRASVTAQTGYAGGIVGIVAKNGEIEYAYNLGAVHAYGKEDGLAGGIAGAVTTSAAITKCMNQASVTSELSYAGGIAAVNEGKISNSVVRTIDNNKKVTISGSAKEMGVFVARNEKKATIETSAVVSDPNNEIELKADSQVIGLFAGVNSGTIKNVNKSYAGADSLSGMPDEFTVFGTVKVSGSASGYDAVGGIAGENYGQIQNLLVHASDFDKVNDYRCLGGIAGKNYAEIKNVCYANSMMSDSAASDEGSYYGGIVGVNCSDKTLESGGAHVLDSYIKSVQMRFTGAYHANSSQSAQQKEDLSVMVGGIAGANKDRTDNESSHASIVGCSIDTTAGYDKNRIQVANGIVGGIVGLNQAVITDCGYANGDDTTADLMEKVRNEQGKLVITDATHIDADTKRKAVGYEKLKAELGSKISKRNTDPVKWTGNDEVKGISILTQWFYNGTDENDRGADIIADKQMLLELSTMGIVGGITGYNTGYGSVNHCMTGEWMIYNHSDSSESSIGGVIGMNESEADIGFLVNRAFVGRECAKQKDNGKWNKNDPNNENNGESGYFVGGIIGEQRNSTSINWSIYGCINIGSVYNRGSNYAAGILGRWTDNGGTLEYCHNYGMIQNTFTAGGYGGSAAGIVAEVYHPVDYHSYRVLSCRNDGNIYVGKPHYVTESRKDWTNFANSGSNENSGIMGNVVCNFVGYQEDHKEGQHIEVDIVDCVNGPDATIQAGSMAVGMLAYLGSDYVKTGNSEDSKNVRDYAAENVVVKIDRCRNYGVLKGRWHASGMFGDRYSSADKTCITNCYSMSDNHNATSNNKKRYITYSGEGSDTAWTLGALGNNSYNNFYIDGVEQSATEIRQYPTGSSGIRLPGDSNAYQPPVEPYAYQIDGMGTVLYIHFPQGHVLGNTNEITFDVAKKSSQKEYQYRVEYLPMGKTSAYLLAEENSTDKNHITIKGIPLGTRLSAIRVEIAARDSKNTVISNLVGGKNDKNEYSKYGKYANYDRYGERLELSNLKVSGNGSAVRSIEVYQRIGKIYEMTRIDHSNDAKGANARETIPVKLNNKIYLISRLPEFAHNSRFALNHGENYSYWKSVTGGDWSVSSYNNTLERHQYFIEGNKLMLVDPYHSENNKWDWDEENNTKHRQRFPEYIKYAFQVGEIIAEINENDWNVLKEKDRNAKIRMESLMEAYYENYVDNNTYPSKPEDVKLEIVTANNSDNKNQKATGKLKVTWKHPDMSAKYYLVDIYTMKNDAKEQILYSGVKFCSNEALFELDERMTEKNICASVRAVNSNEVGVSDEATSSPKSVGKMAPKPEFRIELVKKNGAYTYRYALTKQSLAKIRSEMGNSWKVNFYFQGEEERYSLTEDHPAEYISTTNSGTNFIRRIYAQTVSVDPDVTQPPSEQYSTQIDVRPISDIKPNLKDREPQITVTGNSVEDAKIRVVIPEQKGDAKGGLFPVYRVEITKECVIDGKPTDLVYAYRDVTIPNKGCTVVFENLSQEVLQEIGKNKSFKVHIWLVQTSLGPVYTWHDVWDDQERLQINDVENDSQIEHSESDEILYNGYEYQYRADGNHWKIYSCVLSEKWHNFDRGQICYNSSTPFNLADSPNNLEYKWEIDKNDVLQYTFSWEPGMKNNNGYDLTLIGIKSGGGIQKRTVITKTQIPKSAMTPTPDEYEFTLNADNFSYDQIEVSVVEKSSDSSILGNRAKETFSVISRMPRINQVTARLVNRNDQKYRISWRALDEKYEDDFESYKIWAEYEVNENGAINKKNVNVKTITDRSVTACDVDLEKDLGIKNDSDVKTVSFVVVAETNKNPKKYVDSKKSLKRTITVGKRIDPPEISGNYSFRTDALQNEEIQEVSESEFKSGLYLVVPMEKQINGNYLLNGFLYSSQPSLFDSDLETTYERIEKAFNEKNGYMNNGSIPLADSLHPIVMNFDKKVGEQNNYSAKLSFSDISMAAAYLQPVIRAASNTQISSYWTWLQTGGSQYVKLPKVRLNAPALTDSYDKVSRTGDENFWSGEQTFESKVIFNDTEIVQDAVLFDHSDYASSYEVELEMAGAGRVAEVLSLDQSGVTYQGTKYAFVDGVCNFDDKINQTLTGTFRSGGRLQYYRILCGLRVRKTENGYALILPQSSQIINMDNRTVRVNNATKAVTHLTVKAIAGDTTKYVDSNNSEK